MIYILKKLAINVKSDLRKLHGTPTRGVKYHTLSFLCVHHEAQVGEVLHSLGDGPLDPGLGGGHHDEVIPPHEAV